jgi:hypothetical protein
MFVVAFVFKMSSFQMESLKIMEKFDGGKGKEIGGVPHPEKEENVVVVRNSIRF